MSCYGCAENLANQLAHMHFGGCLSTEAIETPPSPAYLAEQAQAQEFFPDVQASDPIACAVCVTQNYINGSGVIRRASPGMFCCLDHHLQCAYCRSPECDTLMCERCSYSGEGNAAVTEAFQGQFTLCLYDRDMSASESWTCGCIRCIEVAVAAHTSSAEVIN